MSGLAGAVLLAACSNPPQAAHHGSSTTSPAVPSSTLPVSIVVGGTQQTGPLAFLGLVMRVAVTPVPAGKSTPPSSTTAVTGGSDGAVVSSPPVLPPPPVTIGYRQFGSGKDLLLVMGQDGTMSWWDPALLSDLSHSYRVTIFDLPGAGYSGVDADVAPSVDELADVTAGLIDALGLTQPAVLGWGMGGEVALALAERHPGLASMLVLADTTAGGPAAVRPPAAVSALFADPAATTAALAGYLFPPADVAARLAWLDLTALESPDDMVASAVATEAEVQASWWRVGLTTSAQITIPALLVQGAADPVFPPQNQLALAQLFATAKQITYPGAGYAAIFQDEPQFDSALRAFTGS